MRKFRATITASPAAPETEPQDHEDVCQIPADNRRRHGRLRTTDMSSDLGDITDLSRSGLCIRHKGKINVTLGEELILEIDASGELVTLPVVVRRLQKAGFNKTDIGMEFTEMDSIHERGLAMLAYMAVCTPALPTE